MEGKRSRRIALICIVGLTTLCALIGAIIHNVYFSTGMVLLGSLAVVIWCLLPSSYLMSRTLAEITPAMKAVTLVVLIAEIALCTIPMGFNRYWNGELPDHRNQYELIADSFIDGKLYFDYDDVDPRLATMENPYDPKARKAEGVSYHWDHAYYNGKYYMYFGVAPVILLFVPYKLITGESLTTYHATQLFVSLIIVGFFCLFYTLGKNLFKRTPFGTYLLMSVGMSAMSVWHSVLFPALYSTAITSGVCFVLWCFFFFLKAFVIECEFRKAVVFTFAGALCGALAFACRPPVAIASFLVLPIALSYLKNKRMGAARSAGILLAGISPYIVVAVALMLYNQARFGSPIEFGQAYQLTNTDQHLYGFSLERVDVPGGLTALFSALFAPGEVSSSFPFIGLAGAFVNFPLTLVVFTIFLKRVRGNLRATKGLFAFAVGLLVMVFVTVALDLFWAPFYQERYNMDIYYLLGILSFIAACSWVDTASSLRNARIVGSVFALGSLLTFISSVLYFFTPLRASFAREFPDIVKKIERVVKLGLP